MKVTPFICGSGMSGRAMRHALNIISVIDPEFTFHPVQVIDRTLKLPNDLSRFENPVLMIANPHALHAQMIEGGTRAGFRAIVSEKPACVSFEQVDRLKSVKGLVTVCHGYRQMWGPQKIISLIRSGELGPLVSVESRYWQSSAAQAALNESHSKKNQWKNDTTLSGPFDTLIDLGTHAADLIMSCFQQPPDRTRVWRSYANAAASHRDTHVHLAFNFGASRGVASASKTAHGFGNALDFHVFGEKASVSWAFERPDELRIGRGAEVTTLVRDTNEYASGQPTFHGMGWLEGYIAIIHNTLIAMRSSATHVNAPTLRESLIMIECLLRGMENA